MKEYSYSDIAQVDIKGILFKDNRFIEFEECKYEWSKEQNISENDSVCVASRFCEGNECYFVFYSKERVKLVFNMKGLMKRKRNSDKLNEIRVLINRFGYSSYDMT